MSEQDFSSCQKAGKEDKGFSVLLLDSFGISTNYCDDQVRPSWLQYLTGGSRRAWCNRVKIGSEAGFSLIPGFLGFFGWVWWCFFLLFVCFIVQQLFALVVQLIWTTKQEIISCVS